MPNAPTNLETERVNENDLLVRWTADQTDSFRPIDRFSVRINISSRSMPSDVEMLEVDTNDTQYIIRDIGPDERYTIVVCSINSFGESCSDVIVIIVGESATG